ncbi:MAG: dienelactone hydrolase family protein [Chitinophagaceae bacterium]
MKPLHLTAFIASAIFFAACNNDDQPKSDNIETTPKMVQENITYEGDGTTMHGYVAYDSAKQGQRPAVIVIHEWWGLNDYAKRRARELADLGYIAMAIDLYGNGLTADNPDSAGKYATPFYQQPDMMQRRFDAALAKLKTYPQTDASKVGAIGYCFGGAQVLNLARLGEDLKGVVSFHGNLLGVPLDTNKLKAAILVCHGNADPFVPVSEVEKFVKEMDAAAVDYTFKGYDDATHAFTNPDATAMGEKFKIPIKYNAAADTASWNDMKAFFDRVFK